MIADQIQNWKSYPYGNSWKLAFSFLESLTNDSEEKKYSISGDDIFAIVTSYQTKTRQDAILETHEKYIDIQAVISGQERLEWSLRDELIVDMPYSTEKDAQFYKHNSVPKGIIDLSPGMFVVLFPQDAHMPSLMVDNTPGLVKKVVIKLRLDLLK